MKVLSELRVLLLGLASTTVLLGQADARDVFRYVVAAAEVKWRGSGRACRRRDESAVSARVARIARVIAQ